MYSKENKAYWDKWNISYSKVWKTRGRREMSKKELGFINKYLSKKKPKKVLDIGVGNGRILENIAKFSPKKTSLFGIDISDKMVEICKEKFEKIHKVKKISVCDLSKEDICFDGNFDFATMVRVLKYNKNWQDMIKRICDKLNAGGILIFTMTNKISISRFSGDKFSEKNIPILYASKSELKKAISDAGFRLVEFRAFSKLPNFLYHICQNVLYVKFLLFSERVLEVVFGKSFLGRELFVACVK